MSRYACPTCGTHTYKHMWEDALEAERAATRCPLSLDATPGICSASCCYACVRNDLIYERAARIEAERERDSARQLGQTFKASWRQTEAKLAEAERAQADLLLQRERLTTSWADACKTRERERDEAERKGEAWHTESATWKDGFHEVVRQRDEALAAKERAEASTGTGKGDGVMADKRSISDVGAEACFRVFWKTPRWQELPPHQKQYWIEQFTKTTAELASLGLEIVRHEGGEGPVD